ncbi:MAG: outer membrane protein assembly factor BamD [Myxococcota bacterium]
MSELDPRVAALLKAERVADPVDPAVVERLWARVSVATTAAHAAGAAGVTHAAVSAKVLLLGGLVAGAILGGAGGYWLRGQLEAPVQQTVPVVVAAPAKEPEPVRLEVPREAPAPAPEAPRVVSAAPTRRPPEPPPTPLPAGSDAQLARERALIDRARTALQRGLAEEALKTLEAAEREFPQGALTEERTALLVHALVETGQPARARALAATFFERFPDSLLRTAVESDVAP